MKNYRHGEILFLGVKEIPKEAKLKKTDTLLVGSGQHPHTFNGGQFYELVEGDYVFGYFRAKNTRLFHPEHGDKKVGGLLEAKIDDGVYELRRQVEHTPDGLKQVID